MTDCNTPSAREQLIDDLRDTIAGLRAKCALLAASLHQADEEIAALRAMLTESEGGEL